MRRILVSLLLLLVAACGGQKVDTRCAVHRLDLAKEYLGKLDLDSAKREADRSLACNPRAAETHNILGLIDYLRAVKNVELLEVDNCLKGVDAEALTVERDDNLRAADAHFARALELAPDYGEALSNRGSVALQLDQYEKARDFLAEALQLPARLSNVGLTRAHLGWAYFKLGNYPRAAKELLQANQFNPGMCVANYRLGRVYFARRQWRDAAERFSRVVGTEACRMQDAHLYLMMAEEAQGREEAAAETRARCVELAPNSCIARRCRGGSIARNN